MSYTVEETTVPANGLAAAVESQRRLRVMFLVGSLSTGGAERFVSNIATNLDRRYFQPFIAVYRGEFSYQVASDVPIKVLGKYKPWHNIKANRRLTKWIDEVRPDVLLSAWSVPNVFASEALRRSEHRPFWIARVANNPLAEERGLYGLWARASYRRADAYLAVCRGLGEVFEQRYPFTEGRVRVIYNSVDVEKLNGSIPGRAPHPRSGPVGLVAVGRLHPQKRYDVMLRAVAKASTEVDIQLTVLGEGSERTALMALAESLGIRDRVSWLGFQDDPYRYLAAADIFLLTSDYEGLSNALLEAQALGLPAVVTDCSFGSAEVVADRSTGYVCPVGDSETIAERIVELAEDAVLRQRMSKAAKRRIADDFSLTHMVDSFQQFLWQSLQLPVPAQRSATSAAER